MTLEEQVRVFISCCERFDQIMQAMPVKLRREQELSSLDISAALKNEAVQHAIFRYLNLCSEEYYLHSLKALPSGVWKIWEKQMEAMLRNRLFKAAWTELNLSAVYEPHDEFHDLVQSFLGD